MLAEHNAPSRNLVKVVLPKMVKFCILVGTSAFDYKDIKTEYYRDLSIVSFKYSLKKYNSFKTSKIEKLKV